MKFKMNKILKFPLIFFHENPYNKLLFRSRTNDKILV